MIKLEDLKEGVELISGNSKITVQGLIGKVVICLLTREDEDEGIVFSVGEINEGGYKLKEPDKYYKGFKVGELDKPILMRVSNELDFINIIIKPICKISEDLGFWDIEDVWWSYAKEIDSKLSNLDCSQIKVK